ncbi:MAG: hypothetical protein ACC726_12650 [Chloroflexota bacterium]
MPEGVVAEGQIHKAETPTTFITGGRAAVLGIATGSESGVGLVGFSGSGTGVNAASRSGYGLRVANGRIKVDKVSGIATVPAGKRGIVVEPGVDINEDTIILLTPNVDLGKRSFWVRKDDDADTFTVRISSKRGSDADFGWLMIEKR